MQRVTLLEYQNYRYLKASAALMVTAILAYALHHPALGPYGGTWLGYTLGCTGIAIIALLLWYGVRKRRIPSQPERRKMRHHVYVSESATAMQDRRSAYPLRDRTPTMQGWLSAHVYLGISLVILITLHSGFHFGLNVHTLAYILMMGVIMTGLYGVYAYLRFPRLITENLGDATFDGLLLQIADLDKQLFSLVLQLPKEIREFVLDEIRETRIGGHWREQLNPHRSNRRVGMTISHLQRFGKTLNPQQSKIHRELYSLMVTRTALTLQARRDVMLRARLEFWLYLHVPLAIALVCALITHVVSIFFYW